MSARDPMVHAPARLQFSGCRMRDWRALAAVVRECFPQTPPADIAFHLTHHRPGIRLLRIDGAIAAFTINDPSHGPDTAWLEMIGIAPAFRGRGLGRVVLADYERHAADSGYRQIEFAVDGDNAAAIALYERCGYTRLPRTGQRLTYRKPLGNSCLQRPSTASGPLLLRASRRLLFRMLAGR